MRLSRARELILLKQAAKCLFLRRPKVDPIWDDRETLDLAEPVRLDWPAGVPKPTVGLVRERVREPSWTKYERFLRNNGFDFAYLAINGSGWQDEARKFDAIIWRPNSRPAELAEERRKIYLLEHYLGKRCYPDFKTVLLYEDKLILYEIMRSLGIPVVQTFVSYDYHEIAAEIPRLRYPLVSKTSVGAGSLGVELVKNPRAARRMAGRIFRRAGRATYWPYERQKNYVYWQRWQENEGYDLRVVVVGRHVFGYYRDVPRGDFRASGRGTTRKRALPEEAMRLAVEIHQKLDLVMLAVDMLRDPRDGSLHVIELSPYFRVKTAEQLHVNGVPGIYHYDGERFAFQAGRFWPHELALREFFARNWLGRRNSTK